MEEKEDLFDGGIITDSILTQTAILTRKGDGAKIEISLRFTMPQLGYLFDDPDEWLKGADVLWSELKEDMRAQFVQGAPSEALLARIRSAVKTIEDGNSLQRDRSGKPTSKVTQDVIANEMGIEARSLRKQCAQHFPKMKWNDVLKAAREMEGRTYALRTRP